MFVDFDTEEKTSIETGNGLMIEENNISFTSENLMLYRHYNIAITASNIIGTNVSFSEISKYYSL